MTLVCLSCVGIAAACLVGCKQETGINDVAPYTIVEIVPGVWAALANEGGTAFSNAGILDMGQAAFAFDTGLSPSAGRQILAAADSLTGLGVRFVFNSHFHDDHIGGNQAFSNSSFVSTTATQRLVTAAGATRSEEQIQEAEKLLDQLQSETDASDDPTARREKALTTGFLRGIVEAGSDFVRTPPTLVFDSRLNFTGSLRRVKMVPVGTAHSEGDATLWLQADSVLFAGDVVVTDRHPRMRDGDPDGWMSALDTLMTLDFNVLVPGHGPLGDRSSVLTMRHYLEFIEASARQAAAGMPVEEIPMDSAFVDWMLDSQFRDNVRFVMEFRQSE